MGSTKGSITGNTLITIQGTGFWNAPKNAFPAQVFLCPTGVTPIGSKECTGGIAASVVDIVPPPTNSTTFTMTALTPAVSAAGSYFVQVEVFNVYSTQTRATFTYSVQVPLIVSLNPLSGTTGNQLTITGANFLTGSTVAFCPTAKYNFTNFSCSVTPTAATVSARPRPRDADRRQRPALTAGTYYPIVTLPSPTYNAIPSSQPYNQPADTFTHS